MPTMYDPAHPGDSLRDALAAEGWTVTEAAEKLGCTRQAFSRLLNGRTASLPRWRWPWNASVGATPRSGCAGRPSTT